jgi:tetratricopeptide (TPR) repeat protein
VRSLVEAASRRQPLLLAVEDVHWADEGMLDLIDHLARWVRGPLLLVCIGRDELLDRRPGWGGGRRNTTTISLEPLPGDHVERLVGTLLPDAAENGARDSATRAEIVRRVAERSGGNPLFAEEMVNRIREEGGEEAGTLPESVQAVLAARLDALRRGERRVLEHAAVVGEVFWEGSLIGFSDEQGVNLAEALSLLEEKDLIVPSAGSRLAGEQEYAFKHGLIRDVAYERLPKAVRARKHGEVGRFIEERAGERGDAVVALVAEHHARAATLGAEANLPDEELVEIRASALRHLEAAGDSAAALHSNQEALANFTNALELAQVPDDARARIGEKQGDVDLRLGRVDAAVAIWEQCLEYHRGEESLARVGDLHRKIGAGLWHKGERSESIAHYQEGIDLLKDGPPCLELVRLYEEAASLYMHTGDNMLAIYASERALRLAERLGEAAAASRAHGIFGRVFGRIGDSDKALENLERSVELAKRSDPGEAVRALLTLGSHLEVSASDLDAASAAYAEALELAEQFGDLPAQVELHAAIARLAASRADWQEVERASGASAALAEREGLVGMLCFPELMRGWLRWRKGELDDAVDTLRSARELGTAAGRTEVVFPALLLEGWVLSGRGDHAGAETAFSLALDVCERAGLIAQSIEATAARAVNLALGGNAKRAADAAFEAASLSERLADPAGHAAALEATGSVDEDPVAAATKLADARDAWSEAGRPIDAARSEMLRGWRLAGAGSKDAEAAAEAAATAFEAHGFTQLADRSRELVA